MKLKSTCKLVSVTQYLAVFLGIALLSATTILLANNNSIAQAQEQGSNQTITNDTNSGNNSRLEVLTKNTTALVKNATNNAASIEQLTNLAHNTTLIIKNATNTSTSNSTKPNLENHSESVIQTH